MQFTNTGTLTVWKVDEEAVIPEIHTNSNGQNRGGAFLCLPNFESLPEIFEVKHGEYRITSCDQTLPHHKILEGEKSPSWGSITTETTWEEELTETGAKLITTTKLQSLKESSLLRPGFHPYFSVTSGWGVTVGNSTLSNTSYTKDKLITLSSPSSESAMLISNKHTIKVSASIENNTLTSPLTIFGIWSDDPDTYICIEPIIGYSIDADGLPKPFIVERGTTITLTFIVELVRS